MDKTNALTIFPLEFKMRMVSQSLPSIKNDQKFNQKLRSEDTIQPVQGSRFDKKRVESVAQNPLDLLPNQWGVGEASYEANPNEHYLKWS